MALAALTSAYDTSSDEDEDITDIKGAGVTIKALGDNGMTKSCPDLDMQIVSNIGKGEADKNPLETEGRKDDPAARLLDFSTLKKEVQGDDEDIVLLSGDSYVMPQIKQEPLSEEESEDSAEDSDFSESISDTGESESEDNSNQDGEKKKKKKNKKDSMEPPRVKGELTFKDLPPIEDLHISVSHEQAKPIGVVKSFVDPLVVVEAYPDTPALDIDSVLFLDEGDRALGHVFDVIGPVKQPMYCVRFNSLDHIQKSGITKGMLVYCAPSTQHASFVLLAQLEKYKGTDASWKDDHEAPPEELVSSEDELEKAEKNQSKRRISRARKTGNPAGNDDQQLTAYQGPPVYQPPQVPGFYRPRPVYTRPNHRGGRFPRHQRFQNPQNAPFRPFPPGGPAYRHGYQSPSNFPNAPYGSQIRGTFYPQSNQPQYPYSGSNYPHQQPPVPFSQSQNPYAPAPPPYPRFHHPYVQNPSWQSQQQVAPQRPTQPPIPIGPQLPKQPPPPGV